MGHSETHRQFHDDFNARDFAAIERRLAPEFAYNDIPRGLTVKTARDFSDYLRGWVSTFSDAEVGSPVYIEGADASVCTFHGRGHFDGRLDDVPGNGRMLDLPFCEVLHYATDGTVLLGELHYDQMTLLSQLGLISAGTGEPPLDTPVAVIRGLMRDFDRLDIAALKGRFTDDVRGIDEISRAWIRDRAGMEAYFAGLEDAVTDIATTLVDLEEQVWGETACVTGWAEQDYRMQGEPVHVSSPMTFVLRRDGETWKVALVHAVPLPEVVG